MAMSDYSLSDIAAVSEGGLGNGNNLLWLFVLFMLMGGWNNNGGTNQLYPLMENQQNIYGGFAAAEQAAAARQMATQQQLSSCCCENRLGLSNLVNTIQSEGSADRAALAGGIRDLLEAQTASTQRILDQLCNDKIDAKNDEIANLRQQINMMSLSASQNAQTAALLADNAAQTNALEQYLAPTPRPAYVVQNPNCCAPTNCGCAA